MWRPACLAVGGVVLLTAPLLITLSQTYSAAQEVGLAKPTLHQLGTVSVAVAGGSIPALLLIGFLGAGAIYDATRGDEHGRLSFRGPLGWFPLALLVFWAVVPVLGLWIYSFASAQSTFVDRYVITALPAVALLTAVGITSLRRYWVFALGLTVVAVLVADVRWYRGEPKEDWRHATALILKEQRAGDGVVFAASYTRGALRVLRRPRRRTTSRSRLSR